MATSLEHRHDRAVVFHNGPLTWPASPELLGVLETAVEAYFYTTVEIVISSPGGEMRALLHLLRALSRCHEQGAHFRTRITFVAANTDAILVCSGDERIAACASLILVPQRSHSRLRDIALPFPNCRYPLSRSP